MDINAVDSGSRVTRSLRKRLTSIDSENSSRPGTPLPTKLASITEVSQSPSKSTRSSRRNSISVVVTPLKTAKRGTSIIAENSDSPLHVKSTRRCSIFTNENVETRETGLRTPSCEILVEEVAQSDEKQTIITRSKSKSPQIEKNCTKSSSPITTNTVPTDDKHKEIEINTRISAKKRKPGAKSETCEQRVVDDMSDVDISVFETEVADVRNKKSSNITIAVLNDDDSNHVPNIANVDPINTNILTMTHNIQGTEPNILEINTKIPSVQKIKPVPKSKICEQREFDDISDVDISVFENEIADARNKKSSNTTIVELNDDDSKQALNIDTEEHEKCVKPSSPPTNADVDPINTNILAMANNIQDIEPNIATQTVENGLEIVVGENIVQEIIPEPRNDILLKKVENDGQNVHDCYDNKQEEVVGELNVSETNNDENISKEIIPEPRNDSLVEKVATVRELYVAETNTEHGKYNFEETNNLSKFEVTDTNNDSNSYKTSDVNEEDLSTGNGSDEHDVICNTIFNHGITPEWKATSEKLDILSASSNINNYSEELQKKVDFVPSPSNDTSAKIVYPKTPVSIKITEACNNLRSSSKNDSLLPENLENRNMEMSKYVTTETSKSDFESSHTSQIVQTSTPNSEPVLKVVLNNTMKFIAKKTLDELDSNSHQEIDNSDVLTEKKSENCIELPQNHDELKWTNPSAKANTGEGSKIDEVLINANDSGNNIEDIIAQEQTDNGLAFSSESEAESQEDEDDYYEEECETRHEYIDDKAMEVENYESGDSMDSRERMEIELNEIPIDAESIGSQTTDEDKNGQMEDSINSFIVSDTETLDDDNKEEEIDEYANEPKQQAKKVYRRILCANEISSSDDEIDNCRKDVQNTVNIQTEKEISKPVLEEKKSFENNSINSKCQTESFSDHNSSNKSTINLYSNKRNDTTLRLHYASYSKSEEDYNGEETNNARKGILSTINLTQRLNKSVRNLNLEVNESSEKNYDSCEVIAGDNNDEEEHKTSLSSEHTQTESQLGEISVTLESDTSKDNKSLNLSSDRITCGGSGVSTNEKLECQRSFTMDVTFKDGELETKLSETKSNEYKFNDLSSTHNDETEELENNGHKILPLGHPRRQSLALPTNSDMEICSSSYVGVNSKKVDRKSFCVLPNIDSEHSQSFIENIEMPKIEKEMLSAKRKRFSKSIGGSTEAHDHSIVDINVRQHHKKSKLMDETSLDESDRVSADQTEPNKIFSQISSTPHEMIKKNDDDNNKRILTRCNEILEAANRAKFEAKLRNKKNKTKPSKKWKKKSIFTSSEETATVDKVLRSVPMEMKRKDKTKTAITQAFMAAAAILNKSQVSTLNKVHSVEKCLGPDVVEAIEKTAPVQKKCEKEINQQKENICATSAGNFMEFPHTPEKKKKVKYIQLRTGKVSVEPITPKKSLVQAFNGSLFRESPLTPHAVGFRVKKINSAENSMLPSIILKTDKRKRYHDESFKNITGPHAHWTKSGLFTEEVILNKNVASKKTKQRQKRTQCNVRQNFKENSLSRPEVNRSTKREFLLIKDRKRACGTKNNI